ncbi:hypothetical protein KJ567_03495 [Candidatus Bipolaricaulota bacterium]|nr:hypothetical protein [Candidatus Bipolaricaulota bacterium]
MLRRTRRFGIVAGLIVGLALIGLAATASTAGIGVGLDPTGLLLISALAEMPLGESLDLRVQVGFSTDQIEGLMLAGVDLLVHRVVPPVDPYVGVGLGGAITPPPFTTGFVVEGVAGARVVVIEPVLLFLQARYLLRYSGGIWTTGPIYEGGIQIGF